MGRLLARRERGVCVEEIGLEHVARHGVRSCRRHGGISRDLSRGILGHVPLVEQPGAHAVLDHSIADGLALPSLPAGGAEGNGDDMGIHHRFHHHQQQQQHHHHHMGTTSPATSGVGYADIDINNDDDNGVTIIVISIIIFFIVVAPVVGVGD